jgi:ornithine cyclodeaminase/alanine dehydrogenase-like protein (mu-crystallin family)
MSKCLDFVYLSEQDMLDAGVLDMSACLRTMEDTFKLAGNGDYIMGGPRRNSHGLMLWYPDESEFEGMPTAGPDRRFMVMSAYLGGRFKVTGQKWYGSNINNSKKGLPRSILMFSLNDAETGAPIAIMSANLLSAARTGAVPGVAAKYLKSSEAKTLALIGCGVMNRACALAIIEGVGGVDSIYLYDLNVEKSKSIKAELEQHVHVKTNFYICNSLEEVLKDADIVSVATSGKTKVRIVPEMLKPGVLLAITGTADLPEEMYLRNNVVIDNWQMHLDYLHEGKMTDKGIESIRDWASSYDLLNLFDKGKINSENIIDLGDVVVGLSQPRKNNDEKLIFISGGMPIEDVAWGYDIYKRAVEKNLGQKLIIWEEPYWK